MKKIIVLVFGIILLTGCGNKEEKYKEILEGYAKTYYENHMIGVENQQQAEVTIEMLKLGNEYGDNFDLAKLKKCKDTTKVILTINDKKEITNYEYELKCD